jgi:hypothetical protein
MAAIAPAPTTESFSKKPTLTIDPVIAGKGSEVHVDVPAHVEGKKLDADVTAELTPTNSTSTTIPSPKDDAVVSPIAPEVSVETSGLVTDTTLSPTSSATSASQSGNDTVGEEFEIEAEAKDTSTAAGTTATATTSNEANEAEAKGKGGDDDDTLEMKQLVITGSRILLNNDDGAKPEDGHFVHAENGGGGGGDDDGDDGAKMSLPDWADLVALLVEGGGLTAAQGNLLFDYAEAEADRNDGLIKGPLKTSYCVAEWAKDAVYLCEGLSALSDSIAADDGYGTHAARDDDDDDGGTNRLSMNTIDFLLEASETTFLESLRKETLSIPSGDADDNHDGDDGGGDIMSPENFWALHHAILVSHPAIVAVYEGYKRSLVKALELSYTLNGGQDIETASAEKTQDECIGSSLEFLLHALKRVGQALEPIPMGVKEEEQGGYDEETTKKAASTGRSIIAATGDKEGRAQKSSSGSMTFLNELDSLAETLEAVVADLPESLQILAYSLLTEGDTYLVECLKDFIHDGDTMQAQEDVLARLQVAVKSMEHDMKLDRLIEAAEKREAKEEASYEGADDGMVVPKSIVAAAATLVEHGRISEEAATLVVSNFAIAEDSSLAHIYDYFHATGNVVTFLQSLELYAAHCDEENSLGLSSGEYGTTLAKAVTESFTEMLQVPLEEEEEDDEVFIGEAGDADVEGILKEATEGFTPLEIQALKLATARKDPLLDEAILRLQATGNTLSFTMELIRIAQDTIAQTRTERKKRSSFNV